MRKILIVSISCIFLLVASCATNIPEQSTKGPAKTITLPNGEVIHDLSGEWRARISLSDHVYDSLIKIKQNGRSFKGVLTKPDLYLNEGDVRITGQLAKDGFEKVYLHLLYGVLSGTGQISKNGRSRSRHMYH